MAHSRRRRATAEIETLLVIALLIIPLLILTTAVFLLGKALIANSYDAGNQAYTQVTIGLNATPSGITPPEGFAAVRPGLPTRLDEAHARQTVNLPARFGINPSASVDHRAWYLDPSWHYALYPQPGDRTNTRLWFETYLAENTAPEVAPSLELQPSWPP